MYLETIFFNKHYQSVFWLFHAYQLAWTPVLSATIHPDIKRTLVAMSERTGMTVSQVTDEVLYKGLVEMYELDELDDWGGWEDTGPAHWYIK